MQNNPFDWPEDPKYMDLFPGKSPDAQHVEYSRIRSLLADVIAKKGEGNALDLAFLCQTLWNEKEKWRGEWLAMSKRYNDHLDKEMEQYKKVLGNHTRRVLNRDKE